MALLRDKHGFLREYYVAVWEKKLHGLFEGQTTWHTNYIALLKNKHNFEKLQHVCIAFPLQEPHRDKIKPLYATFWWDKLHSTCP